MCGTRVSWRPSCVALFSCGLIVIGPEHASVRLTQGCLYDVPRRGLARVCDPFGGQLHPAVDEDPEDT